MSRLKTSFSSRAFNAGAVICPASQIEGYLDGLPRAEERRAGSVERIGEAGLLYVSSSPAERRLHKYVEVSHSNVHESRPPTFPFEWLVDTPERLALFDFTAKEYGSITPSGGTYLVIGAVSPQDEVPGHPLYIGESWLLRLTKVHRDSREPVPHQWWRDPEELP